MYSVLIVDDEPLVQVGLQSMVDWKGLDVELLPCASNGQTALETIERSHPDIVFTDIKMPILDGLELIRRSQATAAPRPEFIILTSYEDFGFAREAAKNQVVDYLVKLDIDSQTVTQAFEKARRLVDEKKATPSGLVNPDLARRDRVFFGLLNRAFSTEAAFRSTLADVGGGWEGEWFAAVTCRLGDHAVVSYSYVLKMLKEILGREYTVQEFPMTQRQFVLLVATATAHRDAPTAQGRFWGSMTSALTMVNRYFNCGLTVGQGTAVDHCLGLADSYQGSLRALESCTAEVPLVASPVPGEPQRPTLGSETFRKRLEKVLETQDQPGLRENFAQARSRIEETGNVAEALDWGTCALYACLAVVPDAQAHLDRWFDGSPGGGKALYAVPNVEHVQWWLARLEAGILSLWDETADKHHERLVESMKLYAENHYKEPLPLKTVADHFRLSPNYAGNLFRKLAGIGFLDHVSHLRVTKAKELLDSRRYRVYEVAELVGFENSYYFSKVFRRVTGSSPREYLCGIENGNTDR